MDNKKGQATMEFLMTYGWAVLAAIIAIGVLAYFYFSPVGISVEDEITNNLNLINNLTILFDDGTRSITWNYNYGGKKWKYFTMLNATCKEVRCPCIDLGCMAYCIECSDEVPISDEVRT